ncbi:MAG: VCBS repeat-containing protein, partial [Acidobacteriota bacterium]
WYVGTITGSPISQVQWGDFDTDYIVPAGDYDGDLKADYMVWRGFGSVNGVWYLRTSSGTTIYTQFGLASATPANRDIALRSGDYDGDGKTDIAIYRPSTLTFWVLRSSGGGAQTQPWGISGNTNVPVGGFGTF